MKKITLFILAVGTACSAAFPPTLLPKCTEAELQALRQLAFKEVRESSQKGYEISNQSEEAEEKIISGDDSPLAAAFEKGDVDSLWYFWCEAIHHGIGYPELAKKYGHGSPETNRKRTELENHVQKVTTEYMSRIPGHAKRYADRIEKWSNLPGTDARENAIHALGKLGTMEAIQQIARFLEDGRNPDMLLFHPDSGRPPPRPNWHSASHALHKALGKDSPLEWVGLDGLTEEQYDKLVVWWKSEAARPYREWNYDTGYFMPPARPLPTVPKIQAAVQPASKAAATEPGRQAAPQAWHFILGFTALILLITWLSAKKRSQRSH